MSGSSDPAAFDLRKYLPDGHQGSVIITTRSSEVGLGHCMRVKKLGTIDGLKILEHSSGRGELAHGEWPTIFQQL